MFTIKLYWSANSYNILATSHYHVWRNEEADVVEITIYKDHTTTSGTTYKISNKLSDDEDHWKYAFIENSSGKTIDHIRF